MGCKMLSEKEFLRLNKIIDEKRQREKKELKEKEEVRREKC